MLLKYCTVTEKKSNSHCCVFFQFSFCLKLILFLFFFCNKICISNLSLQCTAVEKSATKTNNIEKKKSLVKNSFSHFPSLWFFLTSLLTFTHTQTALYKHTVLYSNTHERARIQCRTLKPKQRGNFSLCGWEMEKTLWFCCSVALFSSPHLFKAVRQQSGAINLNWSVLPAPLWLDIMISGCHSTHWYVSLCDPSASVFCHEQPVCLPWTHRRDPPTLHSLHTTSQSGVISVIRPPVLFSVFIAFVTCD